MWYRRALFVLAVTGPTASLLVHCTEFGADGEPSPDGSTTATTTSTAPPVPKADASGAPVDAAAPPDANGPPPYFVGTTVLPNAPKAVAYATIEAPTPRVFYLPASSNDAREVGVGTTWPMEQPNRGLAMAPASGGSGEANGLIGLSLKDDGTIVIGRVDLNGETATALTASGARLYFARTASTPPTSTIVEGIVSGNNRISFGAGVLTLAGTVLQAPFAVSPSQKELYRNADDPRFVIVHSRVDSDSGFSMALARLEVKPQLTGPIIGAHPNGFYAVEPTDGGVVNVVKYTRTSR